MKMPSSPASTSASAATLRNRAASVVPAGAMRSRSSTPATPAVRARPAGMRASDDNDFSPLKGHLPGRCRMTVLGLLVDCFDDLKAGALHGLDVLARGQQLGCCIVSLDACPNVHVFPVCAVERIRETPGWRWRMSPKSSGIANCAWALVFAQNHQFLLLDSVRSAVILTRTGGPNQE